MIVVGLLVSKTVSQCDVAQVCFADVTDADCIPGQNMVPNGGLFGCCPGCQPSTGKLFSVIDLILTTIT